MAGRIALVRCYCAYPDAGRTDLVPNLYPPLAAVKTTGLSKNLAISAIHSITYPRAAFHKVDKFGGSR